MPQVSDSQCREEFEKAARVTSLDLIKTSYCGDYQSAETRLAYSWWQGGWEAMAERMKPGNP